MKILKRSLQVVGVIVALLVLLAVLGLAYRAHRQHQTAKLLEIHSPNAIDEASFVRIGGVDQWIQIRGENRDNPVILFLHGGPGFTAIPYFQRIMRPWERDYVSCIGISAVPASPMRATDAASSRSRRWIRW